MPYTLIQGTYIISYPGIAPSGQPKPDGDTIKFAPANPQTLVSISRSAGTCIDFGADWKFNVRFEGIDTLELHFPAAGGDYRQELTLATRARDRMLDLLGFGQPQFNAPNPNDCPITDRNAFAAVNPAISTRDGYLLARDADSNGRVIAFVYAGAPPEADGSEVTVDAARISQSVNATLLSEGLAYPTLYSTMPHDLRPVFANLAAQARQNDRGLWATATMSPASAAAPNDVCALQNLVVWPKLFRRLVAFYAGGHDDLAEFDSWLRLDPVNRDDRMRLPNGDHGNMHDMVKLDQNGALRTVYQPEEVVIEPDDICGGLDPIHPRWPQRDVRILGALVNPIESDEAGKEKITLLNALPFNIDLENWKLVNRNSNGAERSQTLSGTINAGAVIQVLWNTGSLSNSGSQIRLSNARGELIDAVSYSESQAGCAGQTIVF